MGAASGRHKQVAQWLLDNGADGVEALHQAVHLDKPTAARYLIEELGIDVNQVDKRGSSPLFNAAYWGNLAIVRCLVECGADVHCKLFDGCPISDIDSGKVFDGCTPLMGTTMGNGPEPRKFAKLLLNHGADPQAMDGTLSTAVDASKEFAAPAEMTAYLEARTHCTNPGCGGTGLKTCAECKQARCCGELCQHAHWKVHRADCKRWSAERRTDNSREYM
jgi:hypothetical protein